MRGEVARDGQELRARRIAVAVGGHLGDAEARQRGVTGARRRRLGEPPVAGRCLCPIALHPQAVGDAERCHLRRASFAARHLLEGFARGAVVAVVELALAEHKQRPVLAAQVLADRAAQRLRGGMVVTGAVGGETARQLGDARTRGRRGRLRGSRRLRGQQREHEANHPGTLHQPHRPQPSAGASEDPPFSKANVIEGDAMGSVNKVILVGNLGADPELKYTPSSRPLCNLRIATTDVFKDKSGQRQEKTEWHRVTVWGRHRRELQQVPVQGTVGLRRGAAADPLLRQGRAEALRHRHRGRSRRVSRERRWRRRWRWW
jgi:primosomal replication protein N